MSNKTTLIISSAINAVLFFSALFVYLFSKEVDEALIKEYDGRLTNKGCKEKKEYQELFKKIGKLSLNDGKTPIELNLNTLDMTTNRNYEKNKLIY